MLYKTFTEWLIQLSLPITQRLFSGAQQLYPLGRRYFLHPLLSLKPWPVTPSTPHGLPKTSDILTGARHLTYKGQEGPLQTLSFQRTTTSQGGTSCLTHRDVASRRGTCFQGYHKHKDQIFHTRPSLVSSLVTLGDMVTLVHHPWTILAPPLRQQPKRL